MKIGLVIPWRATPDRQKPFDAVMDWYATNFPEFEIFISDRPGEQWQHSASRNDGVRKAQDARCDIIVMNDADTIPQKQTLLNAIQAASQDFYIHNPYTICKYLSNHYTNEFLDGNIALEDLPAGSPQKEWTPNGIETIWESDYVCGGIFVFQPKAWWDLGGMDEKIVHGPEDLCFQQAHQVIKGMKFVRHAGTIYAMSHLQREKITNKDKRREIENIAIYDKYMEITNPEQMLKLVQTKTI